MENLVEVSIYFGSRIVLFFIAMIATWIVAGWARRLVLRSLAKSTLDQSLKDFFSKSARWAVLLTGLISCLGILGIQTASFAAIFASIGFAVGMALQGTLGNFAAGIMLLVFRPIKTGDVVSISGETGTVTAIDLFSVSLDTADNRRICLPNGAVFGNKIEIINFHNTRRVDVNVGTDYSTDIDKTREILLNMIKDQPNVLTTPEPAVVLSELADSSVNWSVRAWTNTENFWPVKDNLTRMVKYTLDKENIGIPFPQLEVHIPSKES